MRERRLTRNGGDGEGARWPVALLETIGSAPTALEAVELWRPVDFDDASWSGSSLAGVLSLRGRATERGRG
jgi:hypothetical protein